jgi:endosialidase-like protein
MQSRIQPQQKMKTKNMTTLPIGKSISRSPLQRAFLLTLACTCFALPAAPNAFGVTPAPDGGYPGANTAEGTNALFNLTTGSFNTANGFEALFHNTTGNDNTANGLQALFFNTTGVDNTADGFGALFHNTTASNNTANGFGALFNNTTGPENTANGSTALFHNTTGSGNTATGSEALLFNYNGIDNTANGFQALYSNIYGNDNTANGVRALSINRFGSNNTANGYQALFGTTGSFNIGLGFNAGVNLAAGNDNIDIGNSGVAGEAGIIRIGTVGTQTSTFIAGISGATVAGGVGVIIDANGHLGTVVSSERLKDEIRPMDKASEAILALKPVTFRYKHELDPEASGSLVSWPNKWKR